MWVFLLDTCSIQEGGGKKTDDTNNSKGIEDSIKAKLLKCDIFPERFPVPLETPVIHILQRLSSRRPSRLYKNHVIQQESPKQLAGHETFLFSF